MRKKIMIVFEMHFGLSSSLWFIIYMRLWILLNVKFDTWIQILEWNTKTTKYGHLLLSLASIKIYSYFYCIDFAKYSSSSYINKQPAILRKLKPPPKIYKKNISNRIIIQYRWIYIVWEPILIRTTFLPIWCHLLRTNRFAILAKFRAARFDVMCSRYRMGAKNLYMIGIRNVIKYFGGSFWPVRHLDEWILYLAI